MSEYVPLVGFDKEGRYVERKVRGPNLSPLERAQKNPKSLRAAIDAKCFQCQGDGEDPGTWERVRTCTIPDCGLYLLRRKR